MRITNEVGHEYGYLVVLGRAASQASHATWLCRCRACDRETTIMGGNLRRGLAMSCGCRKGRVWRWRAPYSQWAYLTAQWRIYRALARQRGEPWTITRDEFEKMCRPEAA